MFKDESAIQAYEKGYLGKVEENQPQALEQNRLFFRECAENGTEQPKGEKTDAMKFILCG
ncbi:MAG: hypothetical protein ACRC2T_20370 [Thermoguttaceae bacterium]